MIFIFFGKLVAACGTHPTLPEIALDSETWPLRGFKMPRMVRMSVVLPAPFGPTIPTNSPQLTDKLISLITSTPERLTDKPDTWRISSPQTNMRLVVIATLGYTSKWFDINQL